MERRRPHPRPPHARWPAFVKALWMLVSGMGTLGMLWACLKAFLRLPSRDRILLVLLAVAVAGLGGGLGPVRTWGVILAYKLRAAAAVAQAGWQGWRARGEVYLPAEEGHGVYRLLPGGDGAVIAVSAFEVARFTLSGDGRIRKETLLTRAGIARAGIARTPLTACARARGRLLCMNLFGEVIERRDGGWRKLAAFPAPGHQFYDALAVDPATGALFAWTGRGRRPEPGRRGVWRLDPATGEARRLTERTPVDLVADGRSVRALFADALEPLTPGALVVRFDVDRYGAARRAAVDDRGRVLVATDQAVLRVRKDGTVEPLWHGADTRYEVRGLALAPDGRPVLATWDDGLVLDPGTGGLVPFGVRERFLWTHLHDLAAGPRGWLWVAASDRDAGLVALRWAAFVRYVRAHRAGGAPEGVRRFADVRQALQALYPGGPPPDSGALALDSPLVEGGRLIAWHGEPVWPRGLAGLPYRRRPLGTVRPPGRYALVSRPGRVVVVEDGRRRELALPPGRMVMRLLLDRRGRLWVGTRQGVLHEAAPGTLGPVRALPARWVADIAEDRRGRIWVAFPARNHASGREPGRLFLRDGGAWRELHVDRERLRIYRRGSPTRRHRPACDFLLSTDVNDIEPLRDGRVALATDDGLVLHDGRTAKCFGPVEALPTPALSRVREDARGRLFLFGYDDRVHWFDGRLHIYHTIDRARGLFRRDPVDVWVDPEDRLWVLDEDGAVGMASIRHLY